MKSFVLAALSCTLSSAHVRMRYTDFAIRNAGTANADGKFSTAGPCGGAKTFGSNGETAANEGVEIELNIAYNGGHKSDTKNFFSVAYVCGKTDAFPKVFEGSAVKGNAPLTAAFTAKGVLLTEAEIISPDVYPVDATASLTTGYKIKFKVPAPMAGPDGEKCTISLVEYRNWGGCVDLIITARDPNAPTPPPPPPKSLSYPTKLSLAQTYDITDLDHLLKMKTAAMCGGGDCTCATAVKDKTCLWQQDKAATPPGSCMQCKYQDKDNCLCDVAGDESYIRHYGICARDSPNCLCMDGLIRIWHQTSATTGIAEINTQVINPENSDQVWALSTQVPLTEDGRSLVTEEPVTVTLTSGDETLSQDVLIKSTPAATGYVYVSLTVVDETPKICSFEATIMHDITEVDRQDASDPPSARAGSDSAVIMTAGWATFVVAGLLS